MTQLALVLVVVFAACGGGSSSFPDAGPIPDAGVDAANPRDVIGTVTVVEDRSYQDDGTGPVEYRQSGVSAQLYQDRAPSFHRVAMTGGSCLLRRYTPSSCTPACTDGLCVETDVCEPWPTLVSAGELTVTGLIEPVSITPQGGYYYSDILPPELFADTATVHAAFAGEELPALTIDAGAVSGLGTDFTDKITLLPGQDHTITWVPGGGGRVRLTLNSNNAGHGSPFAAIIECEVDDSAGAITVPAALVDAFPETMAWHICAGSDCPPSHLRRYRAGAAPIGANQEIQLVVASQHTFGVDHILPD
jgi:hypothetical protein